MLASLAAILWFFYVPRQALVLADGRRYEVLQWDRNLSIMIDPHSGTRTTEHRFLVAYYSDSAGAGARLEARTLAPLISRFADTLGVSIMVIKPTRPIFTRAFPLARRSWEVRYERDSTGKWTEK